MAESNGRKGFAPILILLVMVGVLAVGALGHFVLLKKSWPVPQPLVIGEEESCEGIGKGIERGNHLLARLLVCHAIISKRITELAARNKDVSTCSRILNINLGDSEESRKLPGNFAQYSLDQCYEAVAVVKQDLDLCRRVNDEYMRGTCFIDIAAAKNDLSICDATESMFGPLSFGGYGYQTSCYTKVAAVQNNASICAKISDSMPASSPAIDGRSNPQLRNDCLRSVKQQNTSSSSKTLSSTFAIEAPITIIGPKQGEALTQGTQYGIQWIPPSKLSTVGIGLFRFGMFLYEITSRAPNTGLYIWTVPKDYSGPGFQIGVIDLGAYGYYPSIQGNEFSILKP